MKATTIEYQPIPSEVGVIALSISLPGTWFNSKGYTVFVGGSGVGECPTLKAAEALLLAYAKEHVTRRMDAAQRTLVHFGAQLTRLESEGLRLAPPAPAREGTHEERS